MAQTKALKKRSEVDPQDCWAIEDLYKNDEQWNKEFQEVRDRLPELAAYQGTFEKAYENLLGFLQLSDTISKKFERVYVYANQKSHEDTTNVIYQDLSAKASNLSAQLESTTAFAVPEILAMSDNLLEDYLQHEQLKVYQIYINEIRRKKAHVRSKEVEELIADTSEMSNGPSDIFTMFNNADITFPEIEDEDGDLVRITHGRFIGFLESDVRRVREDAFKGLYQTYAAYKNMLAVTYSANLKQEWFHAKTRRYPSSLHMALDGSNVPVEVYYNLIDTVHECLPYLHDYIDLRKEVLNIDELHMYDLYAPMIKNDSMKVPFDQAKDIVLKGLAPLGEAYHSVLKEGFDNRWIDVYENQGKRSGAYSWGAYGTHPYVLLNYRDSLNNMFTLAHEMGHALHSYYSDEHQPYIYAGYKIFVAEVASTCNEALLMDYLLKNTTDKQEQAYLINYFMEQFRGTLYRQTMFAEFEEKTHKMVQEGQTLTPEELCSIYHDLNVAYYGKNIVVDEEIDMEWARIPHFYTPFYVYQYATGYSAAIALSRKILSGEEGAVERYLNFLKGGSSKSPIELLKGAGVDMTTSEPIKEALGLFKELIERYKELTL